MKKNSQIRTVKREDVPYTRPYTGAFRGTPKGYTDALCELKVGGDGVFIPVKQHCLSAIRYNAAYRLSGIRFAVRSVDGGVVVTREA